MINIENYVPLSLLSHHYQVEISFLTLLNEHGLIEITTIEETHYLHEDKISELEKLIRMHHELDINPEGIETVLHLVAKIESLQTELRATQNKLKLYVNESL